MRQALNKLNDLKVPTQRPDDYFAEMVKSDGHMQKVSNLFCIDFLAVRNLKNFGLNLIIKPSRPNALLNNVSDLFSPFLAFFVRICAKIYTEIVHPIT